MKYELQIELDLPRDRTFELLENTDHVTSWQPNLQKFELLKGEAGEVGAVSLLVHTLHGRNVQTIETITKRTVPMLLAATYESKGIIKKVVHRLQELPDDRTRWHLETEASKTGLMSLVSSLAPGRFKKETLVYMDRFKAFTDRLAKTAKESTEPAPTSEAVAAPETPPPAEAAPEVSAAEPAPEPKPNVGCCRYGPSQLW